MFAAGLVSIGGCVSPAYEVVVETPIPSKLDVSAFQRVFIAGFVTGGTNEIDVNQETWRLLKSAVRRRSSLQVEESPSLALMEVQPVDRPPHRETVPGAHDLAAYERLFGDAAYWRRIGEEHLEPLIVTGSVIFRSVPHTRVGEAEATAYNPLTGRRMVVPVRTFSQRQGYVLQPRFVFIDGRTGQTIYTVALQEEVVYDARVEVPPLSAYFELMDRLLPVFLNSFVDQSFRGTRVLLK